MPFLSIQSLWAGGGVLGSEAVQHWWCWCSLAALWAGCTCSLPSQGCSASGFAEKIRSLHSAGPNIPWDAAVWSLDSVGCSSGSQHWNCCCCSCSAFSPVWGFRVPCARSCSKCRWLTSVKPKASQLYKPLVILWMSPVWAVMVQAPSSGSHQPVSREGVLDTDLGTACGSGTALAAWQDPDPTAVWEIRHEPTAKTERNQVNTNFS